LLAIFLKKIPDAKVVVGIILAVIGIGFLTLHNGISLNKGDILITLGALFYAMHIFVTGKVAKHVDSINLGVIQLGFAGAFGVILSAIFNDPRVSSTTEAWMAILALGILCSAIAFIGQTIDQQDTSPTRSGLIFPLEPVFAPIFSVTFACDVLSAQGYSGAA